MTETIDRITTHWINRIAAESSGQSIVAQTSILDWLLGEDHHRWELLDSTQLKIAEQAIDYRWRILLQRYLGLPPERAYKNLMQRLGGLAVLRDKIRAWLTLSNDRQRQVVDVLQEVIQEMLQSDRYIQQQIAWIGKCTTNQRLRDVLLFASIEEYCLRPVRNQPLLTHRFVNYLCRSQKGGVTNIPQGDLIKLISDEISDDSDSTLSLLDRQAQDNYQQQQAWAEEQVTRDRVKETLRSYLIEQISPTAGRWLDLYLQGKSPAAIAVALDLEIAQVYRLREKIDYHTLKVFATKAEPELVSQWLHNSLQSHHLGLTASQWQPFCDGLEPQQLEILLKLKAGNLIDSIAKSLGMKSNQVTGVWVQIYLAALKIRRS